jgi:hypothetical protein
LTERFKAVLILRDVLSFSARETAEALSSPAPAQSAGRSSRLDGCEAGRQLGQPRQALQEHRSRPRLPATGPEVVVDNPNIYIRKATSAATLAAGGISLDTATGMSLIGPNLLVVMEDVVWVVSTFERSELDQLAGRVRAAHAGLAFVA